MTAQATALTKTGVRSAKTSLRNFISVQKFKNDSLVDLTPMWRFGSLAVSSFRFGPAAA
jgi:hypothetical protein